MNFKKIVSTDTASTTVLIRLMVGSVFLSEGIQKFLFPDKVGAGRFARIGLPDPDFLGPFVGSFEIICGSLVLIGFLVRPASVPLLIIMFVAIATTKAAVLANDGFWELMHGSRTDWSMLMGAVFLLVKGGGKWSVDQKIR